MNAGAEKYKMFRNYMVNELQITKEDIEAWTKEAVLLEVKNVINHYKENSVDNIFRSEAKKMLTGMRYNENEFIHEFARQLASKVKMEIPKE